MSLSSRAASNWERMHMTTAAPTGAAQPNVQVRNFVTTTGNPEGRVMLFAHGFGCDQNMWRHLLPSFTDDYRVVLFDHVGAGRADAASYDPVRHSTLDGYSDDLLQLCVSMGLRDIVLVAHSVSAMMAVKAAVQRPDLFTRLVLVAPSPRYVDDPDVGYVGGFSRADVDELLASLDHNYLAWAAAMAPVVMGNPQTPELGEELAGSFCRTDPDIAREFARVTFLTDSRPLLPKLRTPALVLQCTDDALAPLEVGHYLHGQLAGSTLVQLAATGHCPHVSAPEETAQMIEAYLRPTS